MLTLNGLFLVAGLVFSAVIGNAALYGDTLRVQISVPAKLVQEGFTEAAAEQQFAAEVGRLAYTVSVGSTPKVQMNYRPTVLAALAKPLNLDGVVVALQGQFGIDVVSIDGAILADATGSKLDLLMVVGIPNQKPVKITVSQPDGNAQALIERAAAQALEQIVPFRLALTDLNDGLKGDAAKLTQAKDIATRTAAEPWLIGGPSERVMLRDVLAILALIDGDSAEANDQFRRADALPGAVPVAYAIIALNRAFVAVAEKRPADARAALETVPETAADAPLPRWPPKFDTLRAVVAWSNGDMVTAERLLRSAAAALPEDEAPHAYLAQLLALRGDAAGAEQQRQLAQRNHRPDLDFSPLVQSSFLVDPVNCGLKRRF
jgi:hypothetical protein